MGATRDYRKAIRDATGLDDLFDALERYDVIDTGEEQYDVDEAEERIEAVKDYVRKRGYDDNVPQLLGEITAAYGLRDTVRRILGGDED